MIGIGVALVYAAALAYNRGRSGGNINYANRVGIAVATRNFTNLFVYTIGPLIGAICAVCAWYLYKNQFITLFSGCTPVTVGVLMSGGGVLWSGGGVLWSGDHESLLHIFDS